MLEHDCVNFKRAAARWPLRKDGVDYSWTLEGSVETDNGDTQGQLATEGIGIARVCAETVDHQIKAGQPVPLLEAFNPGDGEDIHAVFVGGAHIPARVRCFVDYLVERFE
ncbi:LysR substrate binding domain-containing protein [Paraburkholderia bryophila]|uniref:LysR substrate binding domain-containing protein n=1 Tax=Paraburkholderia bryophila TaxID=420952 RepID=A0A329BWB1_9BURK|nr:LysR substrate binding domain-containing protein [Paraburkholderia bryophila]